MHVPVTRHLLGNARVQPRGDSDRREDEQVAQEIGAVPGHFPFLTGCLGLFFLPALPPLSAGANRSINSAAVSSSTVALSEYTMCWPRRSVRTRSAAFRMLKWCDSDARVIG